MTLCLKIVSLQQFEIFLLSKLKFPHVIKNLKNIYHSKKKSFYARLGTLICCAICFCAQFFYFSTSVWFIFSSFSMLRRDEIKFSFVDFFNWFFFQTPNWLLSNSVTSIIEFSRLGKGPFIYYLGRFWNIFWPTQSVSKHNSCRDSEKKSYFLNQFRAYIIYEWPLNEKNVLTFLHRTESVQILLKITSNIESKKNVKLLYHNENWVSFSSWPKIK